MSPDRIRELRRAGVLDGTKDDIARIAFLGIYESARGYQRERAPTAAAIRDEVAFSLDPIMRGSERAEGIRRAMRTAKRRSP